MSTLLAVLGPTHLEFSIGGGEYRVPTGSTAVARSIGGDPPDPADLTNAIGLVLDHLDDVERELPMAGFADEVHVRGEGAAVLCAVEVGGPPVLPLELGREALEDVFRTLATEAAADRALNPGLPAAWVHDALGACCALVAIARRFSLTHVTVLP